MIIKTCGLRSPENISEIAALRVDWLGFIFYEKSPRYVGTQADLLPFLRANEALLADKKRVGVFVNAEFDNVLTAVHDYELDYVQLHGGESAVYCATLQELLRGRTRPKVVQLMRAFRVSRSFDFAITKDFAPYCAYFLFDTQIAVAPDQDEPYGGTGHQFYWSMLNHYTDPTPFLLSGGIGPQDVAAVLAFQHPAFAGIDVNSKFELEPGLKHIGDLRAFIDLVKLEKLEK